MASKKFITTPLRSHIWSLCGLTLSLFGQKEEKLLKFLSDLGPLEQSVGPPFGVVGYQLQLVAAFFIATSTLDFIQWYFGPEISPFCRDENCRIKVTQNLRAC